ncbi:MAG TPA: hypothetical protein VFS44_05795 [Gemmatimonadaceae bacterium]|nr:hypothetical protein [Gemmatimonadaceae bacterium]
MLALAALALSITPCALSAQSVPESAYAAMHWRLVGPFRAGRVLAVAGVPGDPSTFYFGAVGGGVWKTANAGRTWTPLFDDQRIASIGAIAVAASDPKVIYVGSGEADMRSDITYGNGIYKSEDGGRHWRHLGLDDTQQIGEIRVDPRDPNVVLVAALGHAYGPNAERGVYRSTDGGTTWTKVLYRDQSTGAIDIAYDPGDPRVVWAAMWNARRTPWSQYPPDEGAGSGLWKSTDGGVTWAPVAGHGLPTDGVGRIGIAVAKGGARVYALVEARGASGLYRSDDAGASWTRTSTDPNVVTRGWYFGRVYVDPSSPDIVYVPNRSIMRSTDGGRTFTAIKGAPGGDDYHSVWIDPTDSRRIISGVDQGATITLDGGRTWSSWYDQPTGQFYHVVTDDQYPYLIYGAQQDAGSVAIASRSDYGEITFRDWFTPGAGEAGYVAPDPLHPNIIYGGDTYGAVYRFDRTTGQRQDISPAPVAAFGTPLPRRKYRFTWTSPLVFDPIDRRTLYLGAQVLLKTTDGGLHWTEASPDLTGALPGARADSAPPTVATAAAHGWGVIYTIAPSAAREGVIWIGTDDGKIQRTTDGGVHWRDVTPQGLPAWSKISIIDASRTDPATAYAAVDRHRLDDFAPYVYRTHDGGRHWTRVSAGIPAGAYVRAVRADPVRVGLLYAGTELGVYVSFDDGDHWQSLQLDLPTVPVHDLAVHGADLVAATHGRAFWVLDDVTPLRQITDSVLRAPSHLFRPAAAVRVRRSENTDTPLPPETPHGENPPAGAVIDYWLARAPSGPVTLEILDARGKLVRRFSSADSAPPPKAEQYFTDEWLPRVERPGARAGLNRFVWDLRYPTPPAASYSYSIAAIAEHGTVAEPQGPLVLPGDYQLRLTVDGHTETRPLRVTMDPRVTVSRAALESQLALGLDIWNAMADAHALATEIGGVRAGLRALDRSRLDAATTAAADSLDRDAAALDAAGIGDTMGGLETIVGGADREPSAQVRAAFADQRARLAAARARWAAMRSRRIPALSARLRARGLEALVVPTVEVDRLRR